MYMKKVLALVIICYFIAVGYNIVATFNKSDELEKNKVAIGIEVTKRLNPGLLGLIAGVMSEDIISAFGGEERMKREVSNVVFDWYAPIKWSPVLTVSKEIGWLIKK
ncbi:hypothetical protein AGMMS4952_23700 [Spirochaetia bacterium]|nr:hypothetical protein AGMMS4952_23700 [Spirochaetia bacterium]